MASKSKVAVLFTQPKTVIEDYQRLFELAGGAAALQSNTPTILKDNITWHFPMPGANTTPWQLEGTILALRQAGFNDLVCVQNQTVVTNAFKGEDLNGYVPIFRRYDLPVRYNFRKEDMAWVPYRPEARMLALDHIYPEGIRIPEYFIGKNIVHLPTVKTHMYTTTTGAMKNAFGGLLSKYRHYTHTWIHETLVDLLAIQKEIHPGVFAVMDGTTAGDGAGPRYGPANGQECHPGVGGPGSYRCRSCQVDGLRSAKHKIYPTGPRAGFGGRRPPPDRAGGR